MKTELSDVVVGDVFLFARQTLIDVSLGRDAEGSKEADSASTYSRVRGMHISTIPPKEPLHDLASAATTGWVPLCKEHALEMSGAAYHFAVKLSKEATVPVGIIELNLRPHFPIAWMSRDALL